MNPISVLHISLFQSANSTSGFYFNTMKGHLKTSHKYIEKPHRHDFYVTVLFTHGTGVHEIDFQSYDVEAGSLFFLSPGQIHSWQLSDDCDGYIFFFSQEYYDMHYVHQKLKSYPFFASVSFPRKLQLTSADIPYVTSLFTAIQQEYNVQDLMKHELILSLITQIYILSTRQYSKDQEQLISQTTFAYIKHYQEFELLLEEHFRKHKSIAYYADLLGITPKHLNRITQTVVQKKASDVITERVILEAKRMLIYLNEGLTDIAFRLGFEEYSYFTRVFRKNTGETPSQFILKHKL
ncbi:helix-turn-helix transcriptional regulator [Elizabethkingia meningoseptica]|uniref:AraC family transcriptional regulator n=2 Tax=Elizabethkingia meningoseptica TaxID=238 RepID=A0A1V3U2K1_ELIME|nr:MULTISPECIES: helix-turn-helix domain-containing protein [Elizabethkingia]AQX13750.1 AraC family transcriptional regulator [Elizabethkingia meningoseptica]EJK5327347.1 helix-turn-helix domain-containing protein [Elizabethkingia meningoseptica]MBG0515549.1 helix-turn-helix domain-containing protein [Elizabethkingia meningoseptica]MCL1674724.1 helix-turn-helix transcriptional regulator [Elizabethkingia meningoseptica]MCL1685908.1 helix-turn-helix transcriptional regulator [Elizabethkingia men